MKGDGGEKTDGDMGRGKGIVGRIDGPEPADGVARPTRAGLKRAWEDGGDKKEEEGTEGLGEEDGGQSAIVSRQVANDKDAKGQVEEVAWEIEPPGPGNKRYRTIKRGHQVVAAVECNVGDVEVAQADNAANGKAQQ